VTGQKLPLRDANAAILLRAEHYRQIRTDEHGVNP
jgi:hypothetical protein